MQDIPRNCADRFISPETSTEFICHELRRLGDIARTRFRVALARCEVHWDLRGQCFGRARGVHLIRLNPSLARRYPDHLPEVLAHEYAHLIKNALTSLPGQRWTKQQLQPHGPLWREIMTAFGYTPRATHTLAVDPARPGKRYLYTCACPNQPHALSSTLHKRLLAGLEQRFCRDCGQPLSAQLPESRWKV